MQHSWLVSAMMEQQQCQAIKMVFSNSSRIISPLHSSLTVHPHRLNLCPLKACKVRDIQSAMTMTKEIAVFFRDSNKRLPILHRQISIECPESSHSRLKKHCCTRWVEKQEAIIVFKEWYPAVVASLD